jgi:methyltransferase (TIGR00027 family)
MNPVSQTAYYCCGVRAEDARLPNPVCGDTYAERFMEGEGWRVFERFRKFHFPNRSNAVRHRIIDDIARVALERDPNRMVVIIGCGFDCRAFRLGAGRWLEVDETPLIASKNSVMPISDCPQPLTRLSIDFATESLAEKLRPWQNEVPLVIVEGVLMYLREDDIRALCATLRSVWPRHTLVCDLMSERFYRRYSGPIHGEIAALGTQFRWFPREPGELFVSQGYVETGRQSIVRRSVDLGALYIPRWLLATWLRSLAKGYCIYNFAQG